MENFTRAILVIIAATLIFIATQAYQINESLKVQSPTVAEFKALGKIKDRAQQKEAREELYGRTPIVRVQGGFINVSGDVDCN